MIIDSSAVLSILFKEPGYEELISKIAASKFTGMGVPTAAETAIVLSSRLGKDSRALLFRFLQEASIEQVPFGEQHANVAIDAWLRFGKGRHKAALNFGDCLSYATAKLADLPVLCTGDAFKKTDLLIA
ncbi:type II toxin-antitoxin system VapC family toxin [bacterium]|nr:type II toxin-antitoxin system VapC family toxin [bacterium]